MKFDVASVRKCLKSFDFKTLFREHLGWDNHQATLNVSVDGNVLGLAALAQKRGFVAFVCNSIPDRATRLKIDHRVTKSVREHFVIYADQAAGQQIWHWVRREPGKPLASRDHRFDTAQSGDPLIQRLQQIAVSLDEEEKITVVDVAGRARAAFDVDRVTKRFYDRFKSEHATFLKLIKGIKSDEDLQWYTSLTLNRLMFVYFIQKKGFLDGDADYLRNRLAMVRRLKGKDKFQSFYRYFLLRLFHEGLGKSPDERKLDSTLEKLLGKVPFLNGGFFEIHELEERWDAIDIPDAAFEKLFDFFDQYSWHLDERPLRADNEINPDVVGYIFEKYVNQKQMGAYYTKEDITEYISKNTVIPFILDAARKKCAIAFAVDEPYRLVQDTKRDASSTVWRLLRDDPDRYIYPAMRHGVIDEKGDVIPLPDEIEAGVTNVSRRDGWNRTAADPYGLPTETWREHVARRQRCLEMRDKLARGEVHEVNDLITLNLDIWQFARDAIAGSEGPELLRAFWHAIEKVTVLDPTCGSGAFLFAALRILETLYSDCLERMERFVEDLAGKKHHPEQFSDFRQVLAQIAKHPSDRYFILKSIIINNLFGVDIMEEAVEICKLRLFLKLVAQVETVEQIEPLPDIDFNIRAGNTLVGYATLEQVRKSQEGTLGFGAAEVRRIEEEADLVERAFTQFRAQQTTHGGRVTYRDKQELRRRLETLTAQLDRFLAGEYGVSVDEPSRLVQDAGTKRDASSTVGYFDPNEPVAYLSGNLPHWRQAGVTYFVTFRLADSMPQEKLRQWLQEREEWLAKHPEPHDEKIRRAYYDRFPRRFQEWLDAGYGSCILARPEIKKIVEDALRHFDGERYHLVESIVMPNHVHVLATPLGDHVLSDILHSWKSFTAHQINKVTATSGKIWQQESFDHIVRSPEQAARIAQYIRDNPKVAAASSRVVVDEPSRLVLVKETKRDASSTFEAWKASHQPFHWFAEFYGIMRTGGFDVIIGNPPYVEYRKVRNSYCILDALYETTSAENLYAFCVERSAHLLRADGRFGMIIPSSAVGLDETACLRNVLYKRYGALWYSTYSIRPTKLFEGVDQRLCITLADGAPHDPRILCTTRYRHWSVDERDSLFPTLTYTASCVHSRLKRIAQLGEPVALRVLAKIEKHADDEIQSYYTKSRPGFIAHYHRSPRYWIRSMDFAQYFKSDTRSRSVHHFRDLSLQDEGDGKCMCAILNSSLYFFWFMSICNGRNLTSVDVGRFPVGRLNCMNRQKLVGLFDRLMKDYRKNSFVRKRSDCEFQEFRPSLSKPIIDDIDRVLARHYGFTDEELDFIINYDIKYRMGSNADVEDEV